MPGTHGVDQTQIMPNVVACILSRNEEVNHNDRERNDGGDNGGMEIGKVGIDMSKGSWRLARS